MHHFPEVKAFNACESWKLKLPEEPDLDKHVWGRG